MRTLLSSDVEELTDEYGLLPHAGGLRGCNLEGAAVRLPLVESLAESNDADAKRRAFGTEPGLTAPER